MIDFKASNEETESKIRNYAKKTRQDRPFKKFLLLVKDQYNKFKSMIRSKSTINIVNNLHGPSRVMDQAVKALSSYNDVSMMWTKANMAILACLMLASFSAHVCLGLMIKNC